MTVPWEVKLTRHEADLDDDGHDLTEVKFAMVAEGDMPYLADEGNVALASLGATATAKTTHSGYSAANLIDGNPATQFIFNNSDAGSWFRIDLGQDRLIRAWHPVLDNVSAPPPGSTSWRLECYDDAAGWVVVDTLASGGADYGIRPITAAAHRYWQMFSTAAGGNAIIVAFELLIAGTVEATPSEAYGRSLLDTVDAAAARTLLGVSTGAPTTADYLVGTAQAGLSAEIVVGTTPGGELGGTWASPTVDAVHSGSSHADIMAAVAALTSSDHVHIDAVTYSGDGSTTAFELPAAPFDAWSVKAFVAGLRTAVTLSGYMLTTMTFGTAPAAATDNVIVDIVAVV